MTRPHIQTLTAIACALLLACSDDTNTSTDAGAADAADTDAIDNNDAAIDTSGDVNNDDASDDASDDAVDITEFEPDPPNGPAPLFLPPAMPGRHSVEITDTRQIVPSIGIPEQAAPGTSNNNLDVVRFDGRVWMAWRTAPDHFASPETRIHVVSSEDEVTWRYETSFSYETDLREPRMLVVNDTLFLYLAELGTNALGFEPRGTLVSSMNADGTWAPLERTGPDTLIVWRSRMIGDVAHVIGYTGGKNIYLFNGEPLDIHLFTTTDGVTLSPLNPTRAVVANGGGSEADFAIADNGELFAVVRNETGDDIGWGSSLCRAPADDITAWTCHNDPRKYDSPLMFWYDGEAYLVGRRNLTADGHFDLFEGDEFAERAIRNQLAYSNEPKRCSLWRYDQQRDRIVFLLDLPSKGDTCFASVLDGDAPGEFVLYNYSSPPETEPEPTWAEGQRAETRIYRHVLRFSPR